MGLPQWEREDPRRAALIARRCRTADEFAVWAKETHDGRGRFHRAALPNAPLPAPTLVILREGLKPARGGRLDSRARPAPGIFSNAGKSPTGAGAVTILRMTIVSRVLSIVTLAGLPRTL